MALLVVLLNSSAHANVVGTDIQNFNPTTNGIDFVTVQSSETLEPGIVNFGFFLNFAVNTMPNYQDVTTQSRTRFQDSLLGGDLNIGVGLNKNWDIGFSAPQVYAQNSSDDEDVFQGEISQTGVTEYRFNTKYRFFGDDQGGLAAIGSVNFDRVENNSFIGRDAGPTYNIELAADATVRQIAYAVNIGYRNRHPGESITGIPIEPYGDQFIASAAASYLLKTMDTKLIGEIYGGFPIEKPDNTTDRDVSTLELLVGAKKDIRHDVALHMGAGTEVYHGSSSPDWRIYTGLNWNFGPVWMAHAADGGRLENQSLDYFTSRSITPTEKFVAGDVLFSFNSAQLSPVFERVLLQLAKYLKAPPKFKSLIVDGHTDSVGPEEYNLYLSQQRANSVKNYLIEFGGLATDQVKAIGYGESRPLTDNSNYQGRAKNRRVEFNIVR